MKVALKGVWDVWDDYRVAIPSKSAKSWCHNEISLVN